MKKDKVLVLMSTYNGEKYLEEQLKSIFEQKDLDVDILIRDDGSTDGTINILEKYAQDNKIVWYSGLNLKPAQSFMNLIYNCSDEYDYYALSDQDDYWKDEKLKCAINKIKKYSNIECMYFSDKEIVDENLNVIDTTNNQYINNFEASMVRNIATGCTIVFNKLLLKKLREYKAEKINMHDCWIYRVCLAIDGKAIYDNEKMILYRQHGNNVVGFNESFKNKIKRRYKSFIANNHSRKNAAIELLNGYNKYISEEKKEYLENFIGYEKSLNKKIKLILNKKNKTEDCKQNIIFIICVLINKI